MSPSTISGHAAFFIEHAPSPDLSALLAPGPVAAIVGGTVLALIVWAVAATCADPRRERCLLRWASDHVSGVLSTMTGATPVIARVALGATLLWCAAMGAIATPNLHPADGAGAALRAAAVVVGAMLLLGVRPRAAALAAAGLLAAAAVVAGTPLVVVERLDIVGLAAFVALVGGHRLEPRMDEAALRSVRLGAWALRGMLAASLLAVAVTEKLANVPMTAAVLRDHPRVDLGLVLGTDATTTVLLLGAVEVTFAILVVLLPLPELLALAIGAPFVLTVGEFGLLEVPGHLPVWGAVAVLALLGAHVQTSDLVTVRPPWMRARERTPREARARVVGARVPWVEPSPEPMPMPMPVPMAMPVPAAIHVGSIAPVPTIAPQVAAWIADGGRAAGPATVAPAQWSSTGQPAVVPPLAHAAPSTGAGSTAPELPRFSWSAHPGAGHGG